MNVELVPATRAQKKQQTRAALVEAAWALFRLRGFQGTTVDAIAAAAGVGRRTVFRYFGNKEELFFCDHEARLNHFSVLLLTRLPDEPAVVAVQRAFLAVAETLMAQRGRERIRSQMIQDSDLLMAAERVRDLRWELAVAQALGGDRRARIEAGALWGVVRATLREWFDSDCSEDLVVLAVEAFELLAVGVR